jgi:hypothetical protein
VTDKSSGEAARPCASAARRIASCISRNVSASAPLARKSIASGSATKQAAAHA